MLEVFQIDSGSLVLGAFAALADGRLVGFVVERLAAARFCEAKVCLVKVQTARAQGEIVEIKYPFGVECLVHEAALEVQVRAG